MQYDNHFFGSSVLPDHEFCSFLFVRPAFLSRQVKGNRIMIGRLHPTVDPPLSGSEWASHKGPVDVAAWFEQMTRRGGDTSTWHRTAESRGRQFLSRPGLGNVQIEVTCKNEPAL